MSIASALPPLNLNPPKPAAPAAAKGAAPNQPPVPLQSTSTLPLMASPTNLNIIDVNPEGAAASIESFVSHEHIKPKTNSSEKTPLLKLDGLPLSESAIEEMAAASGAVEEQVVEAMGEEIHGAKKHKSLKRGLDMSKRGMDIALDIMTLIPFAGSVASGIHLAGRIWTILNRTSDAVQAVKHKLHPEETKKEDSVKRMVRIGHDVLGIAGEILGMFPGLGIIGGAISLANDVAKLVEKHVENQKSSLV